MVNKAMNDLFYHIYLIAAYYTEKELCSVCHPDYKDNVGCGNGCGVSLPLRQYFEE